MPEPWLSAPFLRLEDGDGQEIALTSGNVWRIGRTGENAIVLSDDSVSRNHAMIQRLEGGEYYLIDMGSRNGSFVNGQRLSAPVALCDGDRLSFGQARVCFRNPGQDACTVNSCTSQNAPIRTPTAALFTQARVSILVVDIRDYTVLAQKIDAGVLSRLMSTWFAQADKIVQRYGGMVKKHIGDAIMAVWLHDANGHEYVEIQRMLHAVSTVAQITDKVHHLFNLPEPVRIGAGINTGLAVLGNTGSGGDSDFTAIGDSVNVAFRLESAAKELGTDLVVGASSFDCLRCLPLAISHFRMSTANLKGYAVPIKTWHTSFAGLSEFLAQIGP
jgi:adenylate cyclase